MKKLKENEDKKRFSVFINAETNKKAHEFVKNNDLIMDRLTLASMMEMALNLFFKEVETRNLESIAIDYLTEYNANKSVGVESE